MPTPFYHLDVAEALLQQDNLPHGISMFLVNHKPAFMFGNVAPDVQVISGQKREETHFYKLPVAENGINPWDRFFQIYPAYAEPGKHSLDQAAYIAGYLCHLQADWRWAVEVFEPVFGINAAWGRFRSRLYLHNVLRSYLDLQVGARMNGDTRHALEQTPLDGWIPFSSDEHLRAWRDLLLNQLKPGARIQTVEVFASRQGIAPEAYYRLLASDQALESDIFSHFPRHRLEIYRQNLIQENIVFLKVYLKDYLGGHHESTGLFAHTL